MHCGGNSVIDFFVLGNFLLQKGLNWQHFLTMSSGIFSSCDSRNSSYRIVNILFGIFLIQMLKGFHHTILSSVEKNIGFIMQYGRRLGRGYTKEKEEAFFFSCDLFLISCFIARLPGPRRITTPFLKSCFCFTSV